MRNFPHSRGAVAGILKGYAGLGGAVYTRLFTGVLHRSSAKLLWFLTVGVPIVSLAMMFFVRPFIPPLETDPSEPCHFMFIQIASFVLGLYIIGYTIVDDLLPLSDAVISGLVGGMILCLLAPLAIPIKMTLFPNNTVPRTQAASSSSDPGDTEENEQLVAASSSSDPGDAPEIQPLLVGSSSNDSSDTQEIEHLQLAASSSNIPGCTQGIEHLLAAATSIANDPGNTQGIYDAFDLDIVLVEEDSAIRKRRPRRGEDFELHEAWIKGDFWLLFTAHFLGVGSGVTVLNNLAQIGVAAGLEDTTVLLCIFSFCNFVGRLGGGTVSEYFAR